MPFSFQLTPPQPLILSSDVQSDPGPGLFMYIPASAWIISIYSSLDVGLGGNISSLSEAEPHTSRLLALRSACSARSRALSCRALPASARSSIALVNRRQTWHTHNGFPFSEAPTLNLRHSKQITYGSPRMVMILPATYRLVPGRGLIPQSTHHRSVALHPHLAFFLFSILSANFALGRNLRQSWQTYKSFWFPKGVLSASINSRWEGDGIISRRSRHER